MQQHRQHAELLSTPSAFCPRSLKMRAALVTVAGASDINRHLVPQLNVASLPSPSPPPPRPLARRKKARLLYIYGDCKGGKRRLLLQPLSEHGAERAFVLRRAFTPRESARPSRPFTRTYSVRRAATISSPLTSYGTSRRRRRRRQKSALECPYNCYRNKKLHHLPVGEP